MNVIMNVEDNSPIYRFKSNGILLKIPTTKIKVTIPEGMPIENINEIIKNLINTFCNE